MGNLLSNRISREHLKPGDHIYCWSWKIYSHHGIYIGNDRVIHYAQRRGDRISSFISSSSASNNSNPSKSSRVICTTLDEFLKGRKLYLYVYGADDDFFKFKRGGTCTIDESDSPELVIHRAQYLVDHSIGSYDLFSNNCENFAVYCKTGRVDPDTGEIGTSGQVTANGLVAYGAAALDISLLEPVGHGLARLNMEHLRIQKCSKIEVEELAEYCAARR